ncbi:MAG: DNA repair protein RecN [Oscillospiraceae bacterium]|jgi:DNA repair protein RecN (Recombination protein N)|nr:DNA repair protein RecN [Oscillospiraceae bacterium]
MLKTLYIKNLALLSEASIEFGAGLNILTGETGAGKSIIIGALGLIGGERASSDLIRRGADYLTVTAEFSDSEKDTAITAFLDENDIERQEPLIITRRVTPEGNNTVRINSQPVTLTVLRELSNLLIDIHGQNDGRKLLSEKNHLAALDAYAGNGAALADYRAVYFSIVSLLREIKSLKLSERERELLSEQLTAEIEELSEANLTDGEFEEKSRRLAFVKSAAGVAEAVFSANRILSGDDDSFGVCGDLSQAEGQLLSAPAPEEFPALAELQTRLSALALEAKELSGELSAFRDSLGFGIYELDELQARLAEIRRITRKYGGDEESAIALLDSKAQELSRLQNADTAIDELERRRAAQHIVCTEKAAVLSELRTGAAGRLARDIERELSELSMPDAHFWAELIPLPKFAASGREDARFLLSANKGENAGPITKIASGGELSRIMLALKTVLAKNDGIHTAVFDEIDTGVSGIAAGRVGRKLAQLAKERQVFVVTHLPQIAAFADRHFEIKKREDDGRTVTDVRILSQDERVLEISRMTGGETVTDATKLSARELIAASELQKSESHS